MKSSEVKPKLIIFDLDDTLLDTTQLLIPIAGTLEFEKRIQEPLPLLDGALRNLQILKDQYQLALLTQGRPDAQTKKIQSTGILNYFLKIYIADPKKNENKALYFPRIAQEFSIRPEYILSIGNRRHTDIREAKKVGMQTCLFHYGEHSDESIEQIEDQPDYVVKNHSELLEICKL